MNKIVFYLLCIVLFSLPAFSQTANAKPDTKPSATATADTSAADLAKLVFEAHGGAKFRAMKTLVMKGSVDVTSTALPQSIPGAFTMAFAGEKYRVELASALQTFKQTYDGQQTHSTLQGGFSLPPMSRLGLPLLQRLGESGYVVSKLPDAAKKKTGFRITAPDGYYTDYYIDEKTNQIKGYESQYDFDGRIFTTSVVIDKYRLVEGILVPEKYSQRFDLGQVSFYGDFKSKDILVNSTLADDVFTSN
jgi:hypothetical protein